MYEDIRRKRPRGACLFSLHEELTEAKISLRFAGIEIVRIRRVRPYDRSSAALAFHELELELLDEGDYEVYEAFGFFENTPLLVRFYAYKSRPRVVRYVAILSYRSRVLRKIASRLEHLGWRRLFFFEIEARVSRYR